MRVTVLAREMGPAREPKAREGRQGMRGHANTRTWVRNVGQRALARKDEGAATCVDEASAARTQRVVVRGRGT